MDGEADEHSPGVSGLGLRGTNVLEHGFVGPQRSAGPIVADLGKQTMFNGSPFGGGG